MDNKSFENWLECRKDKWYIQPVLFFGIANAPIYIQDGDLGNSSDNLSIWQKYRAKIQEDHQYHDLMANAYSTEHKDARAMWHSICEGLSRNLHI
jgi:hypothetical protein